jgi:hypothetical protein
VRHIPRGAEGLVRGRELRERQGKLLDGVSLAATVVEEKSCHL